MQYPDGIETIGMAWEKPHLLALLVWIYCLVCWFIQDAFKVLVVMVMKKYNIFGYNDTAAEAMAKEAANLPRKAAYQPVLDA